MESSENKIASINTAFKQGSGIEPSILGNIILASTLAALVVWMLYSIINIVKGDSNDSAFKVYSLLWVAGIFILIFSMLSFV